MWCGPDAPSFDKDKMATFERYFIADKALHKENKGYYYTLRNRADICDNILAEFGVEPGPHSHIINGHVPAIFITAIIYLLFSFQLSLVSTKN
jgi:fructose-1,6-bisphosphatase-3